MTKLSVISDTHVHPWKAFSSGTGLNNDRMLRTLDVIRASLDWAREEGAVWVHAADVIHTTGHVRHAVASAVIDLLREYEDVPMVTVWGNHDSRGRGSEVRREESFHHVLQAALPNLVLLDGDSAEVGGLTFTGLGAQPDPSLLDIAGLPDADVVVLHDQVTGASFPSGTLARGIDPDLLARFPLAIVGDIHQPHLHEEEGHVILIPGAPEHHNFGDRGRRGWWQIEMEPGAPPTSIESVESGSPMFLTVDSLDEIEDDGNFYRVLGDVSGPVPDNVKAIAPGPTTVEARDALEGAKEFRDVLRRWLELNPPERGSDRYLRTGMAFLAETDVSVPRDGWIRRVLIRNFFSHADTEWTIRDGVHMIVGRSRDYDSNGAGKSTLADAVYWALYGRTTKGVAAANVVRWGTDKASVEVEIELGDDLLRVVRERTSSGGSLEVSVNGEILEAATTRDLDSALRDLVGYSPDLFRTLGYFSQEDVVLLSRATDAEIKNRLADLSGASAYETGAVEARAAVSDARTRVEREIGRFDTLSERLEAAQDDLAARREDAADWIQDRDDRLSEAEAAVEDAEEREKERESTWLARVKRAGAAVDVRKEEIRERFEARIPETTTRILEELSSSLAAERSRYRSAMTNASSRVPAGEDVESLSAKIETAREIEERIRATSATIKDLEVAEGRLRPRISGLKKKRDEARDGRCPACGQDLPDSGIVSGIEEELGEALDELDETLARKEDASEVLDKLPEPSAIRRRREELEEAIEAARESVKIAERIRTLDEKEELLGETARERAERSIEAEIAGAVKKVEGRSAAIFSAMEESMYHVRQALEQALAEAARVAEETNPFAGGIEDAIKRIEDLRSERWRAHLGRRRIEREAKIADYWTEALGKAGIQSLLIDELAALFNSLRGRIFPTLTRGVYDVQFSTTSRTQAGELRERIEFRVYEHGEEVPYANLSGGQRRRLDLGVLLTMTMAASRAYGISGTLGVMFLDEVASFLDEDGAEALAETLGEYVETTVPSVYVVSQEENLKALFSSILTVVQDEDGVSTLEEAA